MIDFLFGPFYYYFLLGMTILSAVIFTILQFVTPAYGLTFNNRWGISIRSNWGWFLMESPVFLLMLAFYVNYLHDGFPFTIESFPWTATVIFAFFQLHYLQRSYVFPSKMKGTSKMPLSIIFSGFFFNMTNAYMQGGWLFYVAPEQYTLQWLWSPQFIVGTLVFFLGMVINMRADIVIRALRKDKFDNNYYLPYGKFFNKVNSANYFGEIIEWTGFAILSWSVAGSVFLLWTVANLVPRAKAVYERYEQLFGDEFKQQKRYKVFPYIY